MNVKTRLTPNAFDALKGCAMTPDARLWLVGHAEIHPTIVNLTLDTTHPMAAVVATAIGESKIGGKTGHSLARFAQELRGATPAPETTSAVVAAETLDEPEAEKVEPVVKKGETSIQEIMDFRPARDTFREFATKLLEESGGK